MNGIKIIKRGVSSPSATGETKTRPVSRLMSESRRTARNVEDWIDERRAAAPKDARLAFAALFDVPPSATD